MQGGATELPGLRAEHRKTHDQPQVLQRRIEIGVDRVKQT